MWQGKYDVVVRTVDQALLFGFYPLVSGSVGTDRAASVPTGMGLYYLSVIVGATKSVIPLGERPAPGDGFNCLDVFQWQLHLRMALKIISK